MNPQIETLAPRITPGTVLSRQLMAQQERFHTSEQIEVLDHQQEAMKAINEFLNSGETGGHVEMATATGKTYLMSSLAQAAADLGMRTLILAPTLRIAEQLSGEDGKRGLGKFTDLHETGRTGQRYGDKLSTRSLDQPVVITTYQSLNNLHKAGIAPVVDLIIADEAHRSLGEVTSQTLEEFSPNAIKMGFTATPEYSEEKSLNQLLPVKIFRLDIRDSVERGLTPPISSIVYETGDEIPLLDPSRTEFSERELARLITIKSRNEAIIKFSKNFVESGMQGAVACIPGSDLAHPKLVAEELNKLTITDKNGDTRAMRAVSVGVHRTPEDNNLIIEAYDEGRIDVLTFVYSLEQGWDSESPQFMINASPTTSTVRETQLLGRLLRGDDEVFFVDFLDISKKRQFTSLHVLGEETIQHTRRIGGNRKSGYRKESVDISQILDKELYQKLQITEGKLLSQLHIGEIPSEEERLVQHWSRLLANEGYTDEPGVEIKASDVAMRSFIKARLALGKNASIEKLADYELENQSPENSTSYKAILDRMTAAHLEVVNTDMINIDDIEMFLDEDVTFELAANASLRKDLDRLLDSFSEIESGVVRMYHGLKDDTPMTFSAIGEIYGLSGGRMGQIYSKVMAQLAHSHKSSGLKGYLYESTRDFPKDIVLDTNNWESRPQTPMYLGRNYYAADRRIQRDQAIRDMANTENLPEEDVLTLKLTKGIRTLKDSIAGLPHPHPRTVEKIVQMEAYLEGIRDFFDDPKSYIETHKIRPGEKHRTIQDTYEEIREAGL